MPGPQGGLDSVIYTFLVEPLATKLCGVSPNVVTLLGLLTACIISYHSIHHDGQYVIGVLLVMFRFYCDCLDGSMARACGTGSKFGSIFDHTCDMIFTTLVCVIYWYKISQSSTATTFQYVCGVFLVLCSIAAVVTAVMFEALNTEMNATIHDNLVVIQAIIAVLLYRIAPASKS